MTFLPRTEIIVPATQIDRLRKNAKRITKFLKEAGVRLGRNGKEGKSNVTDNESATMMTSHGTIQGYNGQALLDSKHQIIVHAEAFGEGQDHYHLVVSSIIPNALHIFTISTKYPSINER